MLVIVGALYHHHTRVYILSISVISQCPLAFHSSRSLPWQNPNGSHHSSGILLTNWLRSRNEWLIVLGPEGQMLKENNLAAWNSLGYSGAGKLWLLFQRKGSLVPPNFPLWPLMRRMESVPLSEEGCGVFWSKYWLASIDIADEEPAAWLQGPIAAILVHWHTVYAVLVPKEWLKFLNILPVLIINCWPDSEIGRKTFPLIGARCKESFCCICGYWTGAQVPPDDQMAFAAKLVSLIPSLVSLPGSADFAKWQQDFLQSLNIFLAKRMKRILT